MGMKRRIFSLLLCIVMCLSMMPAAVLAVAPSQPANVQVDESNQKVTWEAVSEATEYLVGLYQVDAATSYGWITMGYIRVPTAYVEWSDFDDTFWLGGKEYFISVQACNASDERSAPVYSEHFTCSKEVLEITNIHWGTTESDRYVLYWDEVPTATKYTVSIKGPSGSGGGTVTTNQYDARSFVISKGNGDYTATVYAYRGQTGSILIDKKTTTAHSITIPTLATPVVAVDLSSYEITWDTIEHASSYTVELYSYFETNGYVYGSDWFKGEKYGITGTSCSLSEFSSYLENGKNYFVRVSANDITGSYATSKGRSDYFTYSHTHNLADDNVWVNGEQFTSNKLTIPCGTGTATYDPATNTVTLNNAQITAAYNDGERSGAIYATDGLNVKFIGENRITPPSVPGKWYAIYANKDITISGDGKLVVSAIGNSKYGIRSENGNVTITDDSNLDIALNVYMLGIHSGKNTIVSGNGAVTITSSANATGVRSNGDITISGSAKVTSAPFVCQGQGNVIFSGSGDVQIIGNGTQGPNAIRLGNPEGKVLLNGTAATITLKGRDRAVTGTNSVAGTNFSKYEVTGDPASPSVVYTFIGNSYDVWVGDMQVTDANKDNVLGDGTVSYDPAANTVTLNNAQITSVYDYGAIRAKGALTVNVVGDSSIMLDSSTDAHGIFAEGNLTLTGPGNLDIRVEADDCDGLEAWYDITLSGSGDVTIHSECNNGVFSVMGKLILSGSGNVDIYGEGAGCYGEYMQVLLNGTGSSVQLGGGYKSVNNDDGESIVAGTNFGDYDVTGDPASASVVYTLTALGDVNGDGSVNAADLTKLLRHVAKIELLDNTACADMNGDGNIDAADVTLLTRQLAG